MFRRISLLLAPVCVATACRCAPADAPADAGDQRRPSTTTARCPFGPDADGLAAEDRFVRGLELFDAALDAEHYDEALACAQEATRLAPDDVRGHINRGVALEGLEQFEAARDAYARALAVDPEDPEALRASADALVRRGTDDALEAAVLQARRGRERASESKASSELAVIEAGALNGLGRSAEALSAAETALALDGDSIEAMAERGVALFELLRFSQARAALAAARAGDDQNAKAAYFLGLLEERDGHDDLATRLLETAATLDPEGYPPALAVSPDAFGALVDGEVRKLSSEARAALARTDFSWTELPDEADLSAGEPVLSPTIVGLFRPAPEEGGRDAILLYRRNLLRICRSEAELEREVRDTILHELGHLNGADDAELRDQGL